MTGPDSYRGSSWPTSVQELISIQESLGRADPDPWIPRPDLAGVAGCFVCFEAGEDPGRAGEVGWAAAALIRKGSSPVVAVVEGEAGADYRPGLLALREGALLAAAVDALPEVPEVLMVNASGRDHPRRAGLALHLGAVLGLPTIGVTERALVAEGGPPAVRRGSRAPLRLDEELVGFWVRTRTGIRPVVAHAGWRTDPETAAAIVLATARKFRTPSPLRRARRAARLARSAGRRAGKDMGR